MTEAGDYVATVTVTVTLPSGGTVSLAAGDFVVVRQIGGLWYAETGTLPLAPDPEPDEDPPTPGTLASSAITDTSFTLTVTGASDAGSGLHSAPYAFSLDGGSRYTDWQSSAVYNATRRTAETTYSCRHKVRDAQGNQAAGSAINVITNEGPPPTPEILFTDTFIETDGTPVGCRTINGYTWESNQAALDDFRGSPGAPPAVITGGRAVPGVAFVDVGGNGHIRLTAKMTTALSTMHNQTRIGFGDKVPASGSNAHFAYILVQSDIQKVYYSTGGALQQLGSDLTTNVGPWTDQEYSLEWDGTTLTWKVEGDTIASGPVAFSFTNVRAGFTPGTGTRPHVDDFTVEQL